MVGMDVLCFVMCVVEYDLTTTGSKDDADVS